MSDIVKEISSIESRKQHWENVYSKNDYKQVLWHQNSPDKSLEFIKKYTDLNSKIIDVGCGASSLVDMLIDNGYKYITLLDTSKKSLDIVKNRLKNISINYECKDILSYKTDEKLDLWHDRAVFHFLLNKEERDQYFRVLNDSLNNNSYAIISTFMTEGPTMCAGLDIVQYDDKKMTLELPSNIELIYSQEYTHITPKDTKQKYIYFVLKKH